MEDSSFPQCQPLWVLISPDMYTHTYTMHQFDTNFLSVFDLSGDVCVCEENTRQQEQRMNDLCIHFLNAED